MEFRRVLFRSDRGEIGPVGADGLHRPLGVQGIVAAGEHRPAVAALTEVAVTDGAGLGEDHLTLGNRPAPRRQPGPVRADVAVPGGYLLPIGRASRRERGGPYV